MRPRPTSFKHTLMGRIGKTQKGKFDCENCHGPGSAHVKAGGGRGVGGIISFRPEDPSRTAAREQCHLSRLPRTRRPDLLERQHARDARPDVHELPHRHEAGVAQIPTEDRIRAGHLLPVPQGPARGDVTSRPTCRCAKARSPVRIAIIRTAAATEAMLRENSVNDNCYKCHAEKRGPFLLGTRAGARKLPQLPRPARLHQRVSAEGTAAASFARNATALITAPIFWGQRTAGSSSTRVAAIAM